MGVHNACRDSGAGAVSGAWRTIHQRLVACSPCRMSWVPYVAHGDAARGHNGGCLHGGRHESDISAECAAAGHGIVNHSDRAGSGAAGPASGNAAAAHRRPFWPKTVVGKAAFYARYFGGKKMADGRRFNPATNVAASKTLPIEIITKMIILDNGKSAIVTVENRGPHVHGRMLDVSPKVAETLRMKKVALPTWLASQSRYQYRTAGYSSSAMPQAWRHRDWRRSLPRACQWGDAARHPT